MKLPNLRPELICLVTVILLGWCAPAHANDDGNFLKQSENLLKQAWNPGGDPPAPDKRTELLNKAIDLATKEPDHRLRGTRMEAIRLMKVAVDEIKNGASPDKVSGDLQDANRALRNAIEGAEGH